MKKILKCFSACRRNIQFMIYWDKSIRSSCTIWKSYSRTHLKAINFLKKTSIRRNGLAFSFWKFPRISLLIFKNRNSMFSSGLSHTQKCLNLFRFSMEFVMRFCQLQKSFRLSVERISNSIELNGTRWNIETIK